MAIGKKENTNSLERHGGLSNKFSGVETGGAGGGRGGPGGAGGGRGGTGPPTFLPCSIK